MTALSSLLERWTRQSLAGKEIRLAPAELDLLNAIGVSGVIAAKAAEEVRNICRARDARRRSISAEASPSTSDLNAPISKSSGMTGTQDVNEAAARALHLCQPQQRISTASTSKASRGRADAPHAARRDKTQEARS